jgi:hypothetical protein
LENQKEAQTRTGLQTREQTCTKIGLKDEKKIGKKSNQDIHFVSYERLTKKIDLD